MENEKINIDYLKFIIEGDKDGFGVKDSDFILFKQNEKKPDRPEAAKIRKNKKKEDKKDENPFEESDSDSVKMIQKEIYMRVFQLIKHAIFIPHSSCSKVSAHTIFSL